MSQSECMNVFLVEFRVAKVAQMFVDSIQNPTSIEEPIAIHFWFNNVSISLYEQMA